MKHPCTQTCPERDPFCRIHCPKFREYTAAKEAVALDPTSAEARLVEGQTAYLAKDYARANASFSVVADARELPKPMRAQALASRAVAELAAKGLRNSEIAEALFISENTVKHHLKIAFQKMNIDRRSKLIDMLR